VLCVSMCVSVYVCACVYVRILKHGVMFDRAI
jgi:hypothetical protein